MSKKKTDDYLQLPLPEFIKLVPEFIKMLSPMIDISDSRYIVRVDSENRVEIGYNEDAWLID